jgi:hypothetical protein
LDEYSGRGADEWCYVHLVSGPVSKRLGIFLGLLSLVACAAVPASAGAESGPPIAAMTLVFAGDSAHVAGDDLAVPVECLGAQNGFCSGVLTVAQGGRRSTLPFSVKGGGTPETLYLPLRIETGRRGATKVLATAATAQTLGSPMVTKSLLYTR